MRGKISPMRTVVITGTSRGIGLATAKKFLQGGYRVIGTSTSGDSPIKDSNFTSGRLDLTSDSSIKKFVEKVKELTTNVDVLINNAGILLDDDEEEVDIGKLEGTLKVNLLGPIKVTQTLLPLINSGGQIINISSMMGSLAQASSDSPAYRISKTALNMFTRVLAARLKEKDITVSSVHPGWVRTDMGGEEAPKKPEAAAEDIFKLATNPHETGLFWSEGEAYPW